MLDKSEMIFGVRAVIEAIQAGKEIDKILVKKDIQSDLSKELFAALKGLLIPVQRVPVARINRITRKNHQGVVAFISSVTYQKTEDLVPFLFEQGKNCLLYTSAGGNQPLGLRYCRRRTPPGDERYLFRYYNRRYHNGGFGRPQAGTLQDAGCQG